MDVGAHDKRLFRTLFQRALLSASIIYVVIAVITISASYWLFLLVKEPDYVARQTTICLAIVAPADFLWIFITLVTREMVALHTVCRPFSSNIIILPLLKVSSTSLLLETLVAKKSLSRKNIKIVRSLFTLY